MTKKLNQAEAAKLISLAYKIKGEACTTRIGQNLFNLMHQDHPDLAEGALGTDKDFFYQEDDGKALDTFMTHFVEGGSND